MLCNNIFVGIDAISMDMKEKKLTVIGTADPVNVVSKLRKYWPFTGIISVGPAVEPKKEEPKKEEAKKEEPKKEEGKEEAKKDEGKKDEGKKEEAKKEEPKKEEAGKEGEKKDAAPAAAPAPVQPPPDPVLELVKAYRAYNPHMTTYYYVQSMEENPNACVIC
ncbi:hypothetical protein TIFTF001_014241 [Ficus carica]|uniref:HMA domain-containing protein n=1 Tax=Ficus carica TaxID=3494 RepID=A0AA88D5F7_FICCA|nr:hypothetical protein TIFTF001_014241 [Ficus carica]